MEQSKKYLKITSIFVLLYAAFTLIYVVAELIFGEFTNDETVTEGTVMAAKILLLVITFVMLLPQAYIGIKGLRIAKNPDSSKGHIIWAIILLVFAILSCIEPISNIIKQSGVGENVTSLGNCLVEVALYFEYIKYARDVSKSE